MPKHNGSARERILGAIRKGLEGAAVAKPFPEVEAAALSAAFAPLEGTPEEHFAQAFIALGGKFVFCEDEVELAESLQVLHDSRGWTEVLCPEAYLLNKFTRQGIHFLTPFGAHIEAADACITGCEALVARTGSVLLSAAQPQGRTAAVYYPVHILVGWADQIVPDLPDALLLLRARYGDALPSMINVNTGPSRTADIEKTLVVGVHGPKEVFLFLLNR